MNCLFCYYYLSQTNKKNNNNLNYFRYLPSPGTALHWTALDGGTEDHFSVYWGIQLCYLGRTWQCGMNPLSICVTIHEIIHWWLYTSLNFIWDLCVYNILFLINNIYMYNILFLLEQNLASGSSGSSGSLKIIGTNQLFYGSECYSSFRVLYMKSQLYSCR